MSLKAQLSEGEDAEGFGEGDICVSFPELSVPWQQCQTGGLHLPAAPRAGKTQRLPDTPDSSHFQHPNSLGCARILVSDLPPPPTPTAMCSPAATLLQGKPGVLKLLLTQMGWALSAKNILADFCFCLSRQREKKPGGCCTAHGSGMKGRESARMVGAPTQGPGLEQESSSTPQCRRASVMYEHVGESRVQPAPNIS